MFGDLGGLGHLAGLQGVIQRAGKRGVHPRRERRWLVSERLGGGCEQGDVAVTLG